MFGPPIRLQERAIPPMKHTTTRIAMPRGGDTRCVRAEVLQTEDELQREDHDQAEEKADVDETHDPRPAGTADRKQGSGDEGDAYQV